MPLPLSSAGRTAQVEDVYTVPEGRGRGFASALVGRAVERVLGRAAHIEKYGLLVLLVVGIGIWAYHRWKEKREETDAGPTP